ncbi:MAG: hypothetical protein KDC34_07435 [Saprospiraceae bacterium]|nr:hypothetical protein [Saprospiraceae bacterium]
MSEALIKFLKRVFDIREGEFSRASLMQLNIFLIVSTLLIVKPTVNGLFLSEMGVEALPVAFVLVAVFAVIISTLYARFLGNVSLNQILIGTLVGSVFLFIFFGFLLHFQVVNGWVLYALYTWVAIFGVLTASQFWILANVVFNAREAKRLFGFIGAGAIAGGIFGGYITTLLAESIGSENLPFLAAGLLVFCIPINTTIWKRYALGTQTKFQRRKKIAKTNHPIQLIRRSPHLSYLAGIIGISVIVAKLVDYQFSAIAAARIEDPDELTAFFGFWFSNFNVISLAVQLLLTRKLVGTLGVGKSLFFLPVTILIGAVLVFFVPELWAAIFIKTSDGSLKQSVNKAAVELLSLPIPIETKKKTKTFIDLVVDSVATGLSGLILIFLVNGLDLSTQAISVMIVVLIGGWLYLVLKIRNSYLQSFRLNVLQPKNNEGKLLDLRKDSVVSGIRKTLEKGTEGQIISMLRKMRNQPDERFVKDLVKLLHNPSNKVKEEAIRVLYYLKSQNLIDQILPFTKYPVQKIKIAAFDYLISRSPDPAGSFMTDYLNDPDYKVRTAALVSLAEESQDNPILKYKFQLENRLQTAYQELAAIADSDRRDFHKIGLIKAIGIARIPSLFFVLDEFFEDENIKVARQAIISAGETLNQYFLPALINALGIRNRAESARTALIYFGPEIVKVLSADIGESDRKHQTLQHISLVVEHFGIQEAADLLFQFLKNEDSRVRLSALRSLNRLKTNYPYLHFYEKDLVPHLFKEAKLYQDTLTTLYVQLHAVNPKQSEAQQAKIHAVRQRLIQLLETKLDQGLERLFRLLGLKYPPEEVISIYQNIQSQQPDLRANAIDYLDNLLDAGLKKILMPIVETAMLDSISEEAIRDLNLKIPDEMDCYKALLASKDEEVLLAVQQLISYLEAP